MRDLLQQAGDDPVMQKAQDEAKKRQQALVAEHLKKLGFEG